MNITITPTKSPKPIPTDSSNLGFGKIFTDHMFVMDYFDGAWQDPRIVEYAPILIEPSSAVLHYGQEVFEGLKAYRNQEGNVQLFRPEENFKRLNESANRLSIPEIDVDLALKACKELVRLDEKWVPSDKDTSLYIRPFIFASEESLGAHSSTRFKFLIILSPVGVYYSTGLNPVKIHVESNYVRAVRGGTGFAKTGGNYASAFKAQNEAIGYSQVLWLDGIEHKYIEEVGAMNVFFVIDNKIITPQLQGSILSGITRKSVIELLKSWGYTIEERRISIDEVFESAQNGSLNEMFGTGTAAVISPVGELRYNDQTVTINNNQIGDISSRVYQHITGIQTGAVEDSFNWVVKL